MQINKTRLLDLIRETLEEGDEERGPDEFDETEKYNDRVYQLNDTLVSAAIKAVLEEFVNAGKVGKGPGQMTENDIELEFEEPLMDALLPVAEQLDEMLGDDEEEHDEPQPGRYTDI